jgi:hypothetical protein
MASDTRGPIGHGSGHGVEEPDAAADALRRMRLHELKGAVARDDYVVDPQAVAEAMLRRGRGSIATALRGHDLTDGRTRARSAPPSDPAARRDRYRR